MNESQPLKHDGPSDTWGFGATTGLSVAVILIYFLIQLIAAFLMGKDTGINATELAHVDLSKGLPVSGFVLSICILFSAPVCILLTVWFIKLRRGLAVGDYLGLRMFTGKDFIKWLLLTVGLIVLFDLISWLMNRPIVPDVMVHAYQTAYFVPVFLIAIVIVGPSFEEVVFRGFIFKGLINSRIGTHGTLWFTAIFWSLLHFQYDAYGMINVLALGLLFGAARLKTGSTCLVLCMHCFNNLVSAAQIVFHTRSSGFLTSQLNNFYCFFG
ncbi:CPBP family intramembrane glutamic endopeptidase [Thermodesulfobacteriota bacterium]